MFFSITLLLFIAFIYKSRSTCSILCPCSGFVILVSCLLNISTNASILTFKLSRSVLGIVGRYGDVWDVFLLIDKLRDTD